MPIAQAAQRWIARTLLKSPRECVTLNCVEIWVADFATQHLSGLILTCERLWVGFVFVQPYRTV